MTINPTLACGNLLKLHEEIDTVLRAGVQSIHLDVMDGHYVPNLCFSLDIIKSIAIQWPSLYLDIHLMVENPKHYIDRISWLNQGAVSIHPSTSRAPIGCLNLCKQRGLQAGIVINPTEPIDGFAELLPYCDLVTLMGVEPGFAGQRFLEFTYTKIDSLKQMLVAKDVECKIQIDGGVSFEIAKKCQSLGADMVVAGALAIYQQSESVYDCCIKMIEQCER